MSAVSRVSAFAKRRRLNDDSIVRASESDGLSVTSLAKAAKSRKIATRQTDTPKNPRLISSRNEDDPTDITNGLSENSFEPLVDANAVSFIGTREIEQSDGSGCKIRLSRGQRCSLYGIARLWVREGSVSVDGALLNESTNVYTTFHSTTGSFTDIIARSKVAEFYLESLQSTAGPFPSIANVPGKLGESARHGAMSFRVFGQGQNDDTSSPETAIDIDVPIQRVLSRFQSAMNKDIVDSRILVCGKRSADTYRASISLVNHLLTDILNKRNSSIADKVAFLDLDFTAPAFSAPGTISIAMLQRPVLGPSYTQPLQQDLEGSNQVVAVQYIRAVETSELPKIDLNCISILLSTAKENMKGKCLVIRTGSWLAYLTQSERSQIQKLLSVDLAISVDPNETSLHYEAAQVLTNMHSDASYHVPMKPSATSSLLEHKLLLQSHFRLYKFMDDMPLWHYESIPDTASRRLVLSTDRSKNEIRFLHVRGGMLRPQDVPNTIHQNLVVMVATQTTKDPGPLGDHADFRQKSSDESDSTRPFLEIQDVDDSQVLHYIGLAYVEGVEVQKRSITLNTSVSIDNIQKHVSTGHEVGLILEKAGSDGRFGRHLLFG